MNADGDGYVTATVDGVFYKSQIIDGAADEPYGPEEITVITFKGGEAVEAGANRMFSATPTFTGQVAEGTWLDGSTGATFTNQMLRRINGMVRSFFLESGSTADSTKAGLPISLSYLQGTAPVVSAQPASTLTVNDGDDAKISVGVAGSITPTVQWQVKLPQPKTFANMVERARITGTTQVTPAEDANPWTDIAGANDLDLNLSKVSLLDSGKVYRAVLTNAFGTTTSGESTLIVKKADEPVPTATPTTEPTVAPTAEPTTSPTAAPTTTPTTVPSTTPTTSPTRTPTSAPTTSPTTTPTSAPTTSPTTTPTAAPTTSPTSGPTTAPTTSPTTAPAKAPVIEGMQSEITSVEGGIARFSVTAKSELPVTYQWQVLKASGANQGAATQQATPKVAAARQGFAPQGDTLVVPADATPRAAEWTSIAGATAAQLEIRDLTAADNGNQYRVIVTNAAGATTSPVGLLRVVPRDAATVQPPVVSPTGQPSAAPSAAPGGKSGPAGAGLADTGADLPWLPLLIGVMLVLTGGAVSARRQVTRH